MGICKSHTLEEPVCTNDYIWDHIMSCFTQDELNFKNAKFELNINNSFGNQNINNATKIVGYCNKENIAIRFEISHDFFIQQMNQLYPGCNIWYDYSYYNAYTPWTQLDSSKNKYINISFSFVPNYYNYYKITH